MNDPILISIIAISLIFFSTVLGSGLVFLFKKDLTPKLRSIILGFAGGIMICVAFFGLILPAIDQSKINPAYNGWSYVPPVVGFILGGLLLFALDKIIPHFHKMTNTEEGLPSRAVSQNIRFFLAVTIHNIPEGLSVGFACGLAIALARDPLTDPIVVTGAIASALSLAIGISVQNIPEGAAISIPMFGDGMKKWIAFLFGAFSGIVEPLFAIAALFLAQLVVVTPWLLAMAAGAMLYVTLDEIMPEARGNGYSHHSMWSFMIGFILMMIMEVALG